jgi:hypothetical protein
MMPLSTRQILLLVVYVLAVIGAAMVFKTTNAGHVVPSPKVAKHRITEQFDRFHKTPNERVAEGFAAFDKPPVVAEGK